MSKIMPLTASGDNMPASLPSFTQKQIDILKNSICKGVSNEEFEIFLMACSKTQLDPFMKQIYAVKRPSRKPDGTYGETMTIQTGIDGYRLIAERTGKYAPGPEPTFTYDTDGKLQSATSYIKKLTPDGTWHTISASAFMDEYCQKKKDGSVMGLWNNMPRTMLSKCAEAQALRKAFPAEMSGVYTKEEMEQSEIHTISLEQACDLDHLLQECDQAYRDWVYRAIKKQYNADGLSQLPIDAFERIKEAAQKNMEEYYARQKKNEAIEVVAQEVSS